MKNRINLSNKHCIASIGIYSARHHNLAAITPQQDIEVIGVRTVRDAYEQLT